jgi:hypothetical protein
MASSSGSNHCVLRRARSCREVAASGRQTVGGMRLEASVSVSRRVISGRLRERLHTSARVTTGTSWQCGGRRAALLRLQNVWQV